MTSSASITPSIPDIPDEMAITLAAYGLFMLNWSLLETVIEVAIMKRLELHPLEGAIVTSSLSFQARASILRSFLALDPKPEAKEAIKVINTTTQEASRNAIIHGQVFAEGETLSFVYRKVDQGLTAKRITVSAFHRINIPKYIIPLEGDLPRVAYIDQHPLQMLVILWSSNLSFSLTAARAAARPDLDAANRVRLIFTDRCTGNVR